MEAIVVKGKTYQVDDLGYLVDPGQWDEDFAQGMASAVDIPRGLTEEHWKVIRFLRQEADKTGRVPTVYQACKSNRLRIGDLMRLFPTGYRRGAMVLAGYSEALYDRTRLQAPEARQVREEKVYRVHAGGYLVNPSDWDEDFAIHKADELGIIGSLTDKHWQVIRSLRAGFARTGVVPTVYETCAQHHLELEDLEALFPSGYHRGAVKIAGLRLAKAKEG
ncbi:MAG: TusE/DsrC/DsvC family sulfur relay protein [bacterium]